MLYNVGTIQGYQNHQQLSSARPHDIVLFEFNNSITSNQHPNQAGYGAYFASSKIEGIIYIVAVLQTIGHSLASSY